MCSIVPFSAGTALTRADPDRVVVPKEVRERLGLRPGSRIVLREVEGRLEISPATTPVRLVEQEGALVAVADTDLPVLTAEQVRDAVEATRR
jgi:AbrB family looped-hinge helix DNA binding protein